MDKLFLCLAYLAACYSNAAALVCMSCTDITQPRHCRQVETCDEGQYCAVESYYDRFHDVYYAMKCKNKEHCPTNTSSTGDYCTECCQTDLCNVKGCGTQDLPQDAGPVCYSCKSLEKRRECHNIDVCDSDEMCFVDEMEEFGDILLTSGCRTTQTCPTNGTHFPDHQGVIIIGKRSAGKRSLTHNRCSACCTGTLCNNECAPGVGGNIVNNIHVVANVSGRDCLDIHAMYPDSQSGPYVLSIGQNRSLSVYCDMTTAGGGWTVFQRRLNGSVDFYRTFAEYQQGFGSITGDFWLGLENLYQLTVGRSNVLRIDAVASNGTLYSDMASSFNIGPGPEYVLNISSSSAELVSYYNGNPFTTKDVDRDALHDENCAVMYHGAFWYRACFLHANVNGLYAPGNTSLSSMGFKVPGLRQVEMKFRRTS